MSNRRKIKIAPGGEAPAAEDLNAKRAAQLARCGEEIQRSLEAFNARLEATRIVRLANGQEVTSYEFAVVSK